jgi:predicted dithiol-disulfide oxidoreductase (DUF899 family)
MSEDHPVVDHTEWLEARRALLAAEKEFTRQRDALTAQRQSLPWEEVTKRYVFEGAAGPSTLTGLFGRCGQLIVYHFMFPPEWDAGCPHCSFWADTWNGIPAHLEARNVSFVAVSRAPYAKLAAYRARMGWDFTWLSSFETDFNYDFYASFTPEQLDAGTACWNYATGGRRPSSTEVTGLSVFSKDDDDRVFHSYSAFARGVDMLNATYQYLDLVPQGRNEAGQADPQFWVRRHDEY